MRRSNTGSKSSATPEKAACRSMTGCGSSPECPRKQDAAASADQDRDWIGLTAGTALEETLRKLRAPESLASADPPGLRAQLRHYQQTGVSWLRLVTGLGLGACLADDMGLGKTVQVIGLLLHRKSIRTAHASDRARPSLLVVPASLLANWKAELEQVCTHALVPDRAPVGEHNRQAAKSRNRMLEDSIY